MNHPDSVSKRFSPARATAGRTEKPLAEDQSSEQSIDATSTESSKEISRALYDQMLAELTAAQKDLLYARAELQNQATWFQRKVHEASIQGKLALLRELLGSINTLIFLRAALQTTLTNQGTTEGPLRDLLIGSYDSIELVLTDMEKLGLRALDEGEVGLSVDPNRHEVIQTIPGTMKQDHVISIVVSRGFQYQGHVLQKAKVIAHRYDPAETQLVNDSGSNLSTDDQLTETHDEQTVQGETEDK